MPMRHSLPNQSRKRDRFDDQPAQFASMEEEPICEMRVQLTDSYKGVETLKIYERDIPEDVVENFAIMHNLSEKAKNNLLANVFE